MRRQGWEQDKCLDMISLRAALETPLCSQDLLQVLFFIHVMPGQILEGLVEQDDRQRHLKHHPPLPTAQWGHLENERQRRHQKDEKMQGHGHDHSPQ